MGHRKTDYFPDDPIYWHDKAGDTHPGTILELRRFSAKVKVQSDKGGYFVFWTPLTRIEPREVYEMAGG